MSHTGKTILVIGATGRQGSAVARHLLRDGWEVRALTRDPNKPAAREAAEQGAHLIQGNLDDPETVRPALRGAYGVFVMLNFQEHGPEGETRQGRSVAQLARDEGLEHLVYSSVAGADRHSGVPHFESKFAIEEQIRALGLPYTILRPVDFMDNYNRPEVHAAILSGVLRVATPPDRKRQMIAVDDIGAFARLAFDTPEEYLGKALEIAGDDPTPTEAAEILSKVIGRPVREVQVSVDELRAQNPALAAKEQWLAAYGYQADIPVLRKVHPGLLTLEQWLRATGWEDAGEQAA